MANCVWIGIPFPRLRQHPTYCARLEAGRLRLGISRLCCRLWWLHDLVRLFRWRSDLQHVSRSAFGLAMGATRLGYPSFICGRFLRHAVAMALESRRALNRSSGPKGPSSSLLGQHSQRFQWQRRKKVICVFDLQNRLCQVRSKETCVGRRGDASLRDNFGFS